MLLLGFSGSSDSKESTYNAGDLGSIPGLGKPPEEGMATHSSILAWRVPVDRGACKESAMTERLSTERTVQETELLLSDRKHALQKASST